jgi:hypothetical protein
MAKFISGFTRDSVKYGDPDEVVEGIFGNLPEHGK